MNEPDGAPAQRAAVDGEAAMRWLAARNALDADAAAAGVLTYLELIDRHARIVLGSRA